MIHEELYVTIDEERLQLDLPQPSGITMKWTSNLFNDLSKLTCSYSYTFKLPLTANNRRVLGMADDLRSASGLFHKSVAAEFFVNGVCLCPKAKLYVSEMSEEFSCVMTWKTLTAFETLKSESIDLSELPSLGTIWWGSSETYGGTDDGTANTDSVVYPDYDAGVPHEEGRPPKPCVPVYKLVQMINEEYGVKFDIGKELSSGMGLLPKSYLNNANYYGERRYDDYVSHGVVPLVSSTANSSRYTVKGLSGIGSHHMYFKYLEYEQRWVVAVFGSGASKYLRHYGIERGYYTTLNDIDSDALVALYREPTKLAVGVAVWDTFTGNKYIKPLYSYQHDTGLSFFNLVINTRGERDAADAMIAASSTYQFNCWAKRTYTGVETIYDELGTSQPSALTTGMGAKLKEDTSGVTSYNYRMYGEDGGSAVGIIGWRCSCAFTLRGSCTLRIAKSAVDYGRVDVTSYMWISLAKITNDYDYTSDDAEDVNDLEIESVTDKDIDECPGFQSLDIPTYDKETETYVCHFDFGVTYDARKIEIDADDDDELKGYILLPYVHDDYIVEKSVVTEDYVDVDEDDDDADDTETETSVSTEDVLNLEEGDLYFEGLVITSIEPDVEVTELPVTIKITESLPDISCYDFMRSVFYLNGAIPRVERDGETISAMYYNQLRDRVNDGEALDWSDKLLASDGEPADTTKYHNSSFAKANYLEMDYSTREMTDEEIDEEVDIYNDGYGTLAIDDDTLDDEATPFTSVFYPAYIQNLRYPLVKTGNTCKVWEGDGTLADDVSPIYGVMVFRTLDPTFEDTTVTRPDISDVYTYHKRMDIFSPFDDADLFEQLFGYLSTILNNYQLVKERMLLTEVDLREFDEAMPVYLRKYNSYFAVSTIQRDDEGVSTVELVRLPRVEGTITAIDTTYSVELKTGGTVTFDTGDGDSSSVYAKTSDEGDWEETDVRQLEYGDETYYAITSDSTDEPVLRVFCAPIGHYTYTYVDPNTLEEVTLSRSEAYAYWDGEDWESTQDTDDDGNYVGYHSVTSLDAGWHIVKIVVPIRNQYGEIVETREWESSIFVGSQSAGDADATEERYTVELTSELTTLTLTHTVEVSSGTKSAEIVARPSGVDWDGNVLSIPDSDGNYATYGWSSLYTSGATDNKYTLAFTVPNSLSYTLTAYVGTTKLYSQSMTVKLRTYLDDERVLEDTTLTIAKSSRSYHVLKFIADIVNADGDVVKEIRRRFIWFDYYYDLSVVAEDFGDEHDDDGTVVATGVTIDGDTFIADFSEHYFTFSPVPTYSDVTPESYEVSLESDDDTNLVATVDGTDGVILQSSSLPEEGAAVTVTVTGTVNGTTITGETSVILISPTLYVKGATDIAAEDGSGSAVFTVYVMPTMTEATITAAECDDDAFTAVFSGSLLTVSVDGITEDTTAALTLNVSYNGVSVTETIDITAVWSKGKTLFIDDVDRLDEEHVLIVGSNGTLYDETEWDASGLLLASCEGIAVSDGTNRFIIAPSLANDSEKCRWGAWSWSVDVGDSEDDYDGEGNTAEIISVVANESDGYFLESPYCAAGVAEAFVFASGATGYLPALGEMLLVETYLQEIEDMLSVVGGLSLDGYTYWTSSVVPCGSYLDKRIDYSATLFKISDGSCSHALALRRQQYPYVRAARSIYVDED